MEDQRSPLLTWAHFGQGRNMEELKHSVLCTTLELEQTWLAVQEELKNRDNQLNHLRGLLNKAIRERDEANRKSQTFLLEKLLLLQQKQQQTAHHSNISSTEDDNGNEPRRVIESIDFSSSDCEESILTSPPPPQVAGVEVEVEMKWEVGENALPEKGKLLQAVMKAGPLLETLLVAGPLPQWKHPPPSLKSYEIPLVTITPPQLHHHHDYFLANHGTANSKRVVPSETTTESPKQSKCPRLFLQ